MIKDTMPKDTPRLTMAPTPHVYDYGVWKAFAPIEAASAETLDNAAEGINTAQRLTIAASQKNQSVVLCNPEISRIRSGYEQETLKTLIDAPVDADCITVAYVRNLAFDTGNPDLTGGGVIIVQDVNKKVLDCHEVNEYRVLSPGIGYMTRKHPSFNNICKPCAPIESGTRLTKSPSVTDDDIYVNGIGVKFMTSSDPLLEEDAGLIAESVVDRLSFMHLTSQTFNLSANEILANLYGDDEEPKFFPDIGEQVAIDGVLMAAISVDEKHTARLFSKRPTKVSFMDDEYIRVNPESIVVDVSVDFNPDVIFRDIKSKSPIYKQLHKFYTSKLRYTKQIIDIYTEYTRKGYTLSPRLNVLVTRCLQWNSIYNSSSKKKLIPKLADKEISNVCITITTGYIERIGVGAKIACSAGAKNIIGTVVPDKYMPVDEQGIQAEFVIANVSVFARMNMQQKYYTFINRLSALIIDRAKRGEYGSEQKTYQYILQYLADVNPDFGIQVDEFVGDSLNRKLDFLHDIYERGLYIFLWKYSIHVTPERILFLKRKYNYIKSRVRFSKFIDGEWKEFVTKFPCEIGEKQVILLGKIPDKALLAVSTAHTNQFNLPIKVSSKDIKRQYACSPTPINFGFDEMGLVMNALSGDDTCRFMMIMAGCPSATNALIEHKLTAKHPSRLHRLDMTTEDMVDKSESIGIFRNIWSNCGYDVVNVEEVLPPKFNCP